ncbi:MAG: site-specific DNA-methyltransferase [Deltaproteobacteria bacterium]|nr:site-specific DNA-methyltransferase [Deltaproteobacteria bacterium]
MSNTAELAFEYKAQKIGQSMILHADCFEWLSKVAENTIHAIVTDPPYGVKEFDDHELEKRANGKGGVWRIPPSFDGCARAPLPRFTAHNDKERDRLRKFFEDWAALTTRALRPGGHVIVATSSIVAALIYGALTKGGLEFRGQLMRTVRTLRGGDRPKNAHEEFPDVCVVPRGRYEPWGLFRKPLLPKMKVSDCLKEFQTGGLRRLADGNPFADLIESERTPRLEKEIAAHPSLKPQSFMRLLVYAVLPLGAGLVVDPFMGAGSTIAAAEAVGVQALGLERNRQFFDLATNAIPRLKALKIPGVDELVGRGQPGLFDNSSAKIRAISLKSDKSNSPSTCRSLFS